MKPTTVAVFLTATVVGAAPAPCDAPSTFKIAAQPLNNTARKTWLQHFDNSGSFNYQFLFGSTVTQDYADPFTFDAASGRLATDVVSNTGTTHYESLSPTINQLLNLTTTQSDPSGSLAVSCATPGIQYLVDTATTTNSQAPWLLCQIPGWTTGLTEIYYNPVSDTTGVDNHEGGTYPCTRVGLSLNPA